MNLLSHLTPSERNSLEQALREVTARFPEEIRFMALFGSKARGDFGSDSDIDLLIIREGDDWQTRHAIRDPIYDANIEYTVMISPWVIGWERFQRLLSWQPGLFATLCRDAIELWRRPGTDSPLGLPESATTA